MKRLVLLVLVILCLSLSFTLPSESLNPTVKAGPGDGEDGEIRSIGELEDLLIFISDENYGSNTSRSSDITFMKASRDDDDGDSEEHESVTMTETTVIFKSVGESSKKSTYKLDRTLTIYITEDASYYVSKGTLTSNTVGEDSYTDPVEFDMVFDFRMYVDEYVTMFRFDQLLISTNDASFDIPDFSKIIGKWIGLPSDCEGNVFEMVDSMNEANLGQFADFITEGMEKKFDKNGKIYTYKDDVDENTDLSLKVDFSRPDNPFITLTIDGKTEREIGVNGSYNSYEIPASRTYMLDEISFYNIDNTVIEINDDNVLEFDDIEELEEYLEG